MTGIAHMQCALGRCSTLRTAQELAGTEGTIAVWQDSRITDAMRSKLWRNGGKIAFAGQAANPAIVALQDASGAVRATLVLDEPLADLEALSTGASPPPYLLSVDYPIAGVAFIDRAILDVDIDKPQIAFATFLGPTSVRAQLPTLEFVMAPAPGPKMLVTFDSNFEIQTNAADHSARIAEISCTPSSYIDYKTRGSVRVNLITRTEFKLNGGQRRAQTLTRVVGASIATACRDGHRIRARIRR